MAYIRGLTVHWNRLTQSTIYTGDQHYGKTVATKPLKITLHKPPPGAMNHYLLIINQLEMKFYQKFFCPSVQKIILKMLSTNFQPIWPEANDLMPLPQIFKAIIKFNLLMPRSKHCREMGQYLFCWCPGSFCHQGISSSYGIDGKINGSLPAMSQDFNYLCPPFQAMILNTNTYKLIEAWWIHMAW